MEFKFTYFAQKRFYRIGFEAAPFETIPFVRELRFWGVDRVPCPALSTVAGLVALGAQRPSSVTVPGVTMTPPVCQTIARHFEINVHPGELDTERRNLLGGDRVIAPCRFAHAPTVGILQGTVEVVTWCSLSDIHGPFGGTIRSNLDAFELSESEKNVITALCAAGRHVGHIMLDDVDPALCALMHSLGLEVADLPVSHTA